MLSAMDVARYFVALCDREAGDNLSNLKLQKLLYYAQGVSLALNGVRLFDEQVEAWNHGPVVPTVYHELKHFGSGEVRFDDFDDLDFTLFEPDVREILDEVYDVYGQFSAWKLRNMTHEEPPWVNTPKGTVITEQSLMDYFKTRIISNEKGAPA